MTSTARGWVKGDPAKYVSGHQGKDRIKWPVDGMVRCSSCGEQKVVGEFYRDANRPSGLDPRCKVCQGKKLAAWWASPRGLGKARTYSTARRARKREQFVEHVEASTLYVRDRGLCGICGEPAPFADFHIDHVIPLARGGEHSYANTQVAHGSCNSRKRHQILANTNHSPAL